jgi:amidase
MPYGDPREVDLRGLRLAFFTRNGIADADPETAAVIREAAQALEAQGAIVEEKVPPGIEQSYDMEMKLIGPDGGDGLRQFLANIGSNPIHPLLEGWLAKLEPYRTNVSGFAEYWATLHQFRAGMFHFMQNYDAILSPVSASPALPHGTSIEDSNFRGFSYTMTYNVTGWPVAVVRCGESHDGLPIGVQIATGPWREDIVLAIASRLEEIFDGWKPATACKRERAPARD